MATPTTLKEKCRAGISSDAERVTLWPRLLRPAGQPAGTPAEVLEEGRRLAKMLQGALPDEQDVGGQTALVLNCLEQRARGLGSVKRKSLGALVAQLFKRVGWEAALVVSVLALVADASAEMPRIPTSEQDLTSDAEAFRAIFKALMPKTFSAASALNAIDDKYLLPAFESCLVSVLHPSQIPRLLDVFFCEGKKTVFRYLLATFSCNKSKLKTTQFPDAEAFWRSVSLNDDADELSRQAFVPKITIFRQLLRPVSRSFLSSAKTAALLAQQLPSRPSSSSSSSPLPSSSSFSSSVLQQSDAISSDCTLLPTAAKQTLSKHIRKCVYKSLSRVVYRLSRDGAGMDILQNSLLGHRGPVLLVVLGHEGLLVGAFVSTGGIHHGAGVGGSKYSQSGDGYSVLFKHADDFTAIYDWRGLADASEFCAAAKDHVAFGINALVLGKDLDHASSDLGPSSTYRLDRGLFHPEFTSPILDIEVVV